MPEALEPQELEDAAQLIAGRSDLAIENARAFVLDVFGMGVRFEERLAQARATEARLGRTAA